MFWNTARKHYKNVTAEDADIVAYQRVAASIQQFADRGIVGRIQDMGHRWVAERTPRGRVLEIGFGRGRHANFFRGDTTQYFVSEYAAEYTQSDQWQRCRGRGLRCDARALPYASGQFDAVVSVYNLEHIVELNDVAREAARVLKPGGLFLVALPCEGGLCWNLGRELTTRRVFRRKYGINYDKVIAFEHVWDLPGVLAGIAASGLFEIDAKTMLPMRIPSHHLNLIAGIVYRKAG